MYYSLRRRILFENVFSFCVLTSSLDSLELLSPLHFKESAWAELVVTLTRLEQEREG